MKLISSEVNHGGNQRRGDIHIKGVQGHPNNLTIFYITFIINSDEGNLLYGQWWKQRGWDFTIDRGSDGEGGGEARQRAMI